MKQLLAVFIAFGFIVTGCAQKEEVKTDSTVAAASDAKDTCEKCDKADCKCDHHKASATCAECQKTGKECDACKKHHADCKECSGHHGKEHKKDGKGKKKAK